MKKLLLFLFVFNYLSLLSAATVLPSVEEIKEGADNNFKRYSDYEFIYNVRSKNSQGVFENTQNVFRLHVPKEGYPWQCIIIKKDHDTRQQIDRFMAFNGGETMVYDRSELRKDNWSKASKIAGFGWDRFLDDSYPIFLSTSIVGLPLTNLSPHAYESFWTPKKEFFQTPTEQSTLDGHDVLVYRYVIRGYEHELRYLVNGSSYVLVGAYSKNLNTGKVLMEVKTEAIGEKDGIVFPKKGHVFREVALATSEGSKYQGTDYFFDVVEVNRLDKVSQNSWLPEVPPGTIIADHINGGTVTIPFSEEQQKEILAKAEGLTPPTGGIGYLILRVFCVTLGFIMIIVGIYSRCTRKKAGNS